MRKLIAAINMTLDGFCDHTAGIADAALHEHYNELFRNADTLLLGRITYQLMENSWPSVVQQPTGVKAVDDFAVLMEHIEKVVFSHTLKNVTWNNARVAYNDLEEETLKLKQQKGRNILVGSPSLIAALANLDMIDEYQLCIHPIILSNGLILFKNISNRLDLHLTRTKLFDSGVVLLCYTPVSNKK